MVTYKSVDVCTYMWIFALLLTFKVARYNCERFENSLFETIYSNDNLAFAPSSVLVNLQFASTLAENETLREILALVKDADADNELPSDARSDLIVLLNKGKHLRKCLPKGYSSVVKRVNFSNPSISRINSWISKKTERYIKNISMPEMYTENTLMNLVSTIYIAPQWRKPFHAVKTKSNQSMLHQYSRFYYGDLKDLKALAVVMKFYSSYLRMLVLMPNDNDLRRLSEDLRHVDITKLKRKLKKKKLSLYFPKLNNIHMTKSLIKPLKNTYGIKQAFTKNADFGQLKPCGGDSYVKQFKHYGTMSTDRHSAHFIALTAVQWDMYNNKNVIPADDVPLENTYFNLSDREVQLEDELEKNYAYKQQNNVTEALFDRSFFYAIIFDKSVIFVGTVLVE